MRAVNILWGVLALCLAGHAPAYTIGLTDVGRLDKFLMETGAVRGDNNGALPGKGSSVSNELAWVNTKLDPDTTFTSREESVDYFRVDGQRNIFAFQLKYAPAYFVIKNSTNWALYENNASYDWGVFQLSDLQLSRWNLGGSGTLIISHVTEFGRVEVSEPGALVLLALGVCCLVSARRRMLV